MVVYDCGGPMVYPNIALNSRSDYIWETELCAFPLH